MGVKYVYVVNNDPPKWVQESRANRGLDPKTGRKPENVGQPLLGGWVAVVVMLGAIGLWLWFCVALVMTFAS